MEGYKAIIGLSV